MYLKKKNEQNIVCRNDSTVKSKLEEQVVDGGSWDTTSVQSKKMLYADEYLYYVHEIGRSVSAVQVPVLV